MKLKIIKFIILFILCFSLPLAHSNELKICTDANYWFPFSFEENNIPRGIHIDIAKKALTNLGYLPNFEPLPWKRCFKEAEAGHVDAIVSASYNAERARFLHYPADATSSGRSKWRIMQVEYVVITVRNTEFTLSGDIKKLPLPVRAPLGYSIIANLKAEGIEVVTAPDVRQCVEQLINGGKGSVVTAKENAEHLSTKDTYKGKILIHSTPITSKSYYMVFSKKSSAINATEINSIWQEIHTLRENKPYMYELFKKY